MRLPPEDKIRLLHAQVDERSRRIVKTLGRDMRCGPGCIDCCRDDLTVFEIEALRIRQDYPHVLRQSPAPKGRCAFLSVDDRCRIYDARPYVCRTQGLPLRWLDESDDGWVEYRDICPQNDADPPVETLDKDHCFEIGPAEETLRELQMELSKGDMTRVELRKLFDD
jgi:uncharacterized protein